jgi:aryl-alcohol dehydrogenase-like predicted oxidoreductase
MEYRFLGRTGVRVSRLAFGTMSFGGDADEATSRALYARCRDAGINFFDCADVYAKGRSEEILGKLVADSRSDVVISTKAYFPTASGPNSRGSSRYHLVRALEASLRRLGTEYVDVFFLHRYDESTPLDETLRAIETLVQQGKILYPAVSNFSAWQTALALGHARGLGRQPIVAVQPMYNLLKRQAEVEILPLARAEGLGVLTYSPLAGGLLSGKYGVERRPEAGRLIENRMYQTRYAAPTNYEIADALAALAKEVGHHPAALAIAWVASHPVVTAPILGARNMEQLEPCLAAADLALDSALIERIGGLSPAPPPATDRNEELSDHNYGAR